MYGISATEQVAGRGQGTNKWVSPPGNLYVTFTFNLPLELIKYMLFCSTLSVTETINEILESNGK